VRRGERGFLRLALLGSAALHGAVGGLFWVASRSSAEVPRMRVYAVDIVSPPPRELGEWSPAPAGDPGAPEEAAPAPAKPEPEPAAEPPAPKEPSPAPKATTPSPAPKETPKAPAPKETPRSTPRTPAPKETPRETPKETPKSATPAPKSTTPRGTGNSGESGRSIGANPDASSAGGENLDVRTEGARFVEPGYLENIVRQVNRYFRRPSGSVTDEAEVRFWINRDGSVSDIEVIRSSGSFRFRAAAMEAVEQAGNRKAFGALPKAYPADRLPVSFYFRPAR
jgi:periplasmic protein TonB